MTIHSTIVRWLLHFHSLWLNVRLVVEVDEQHQECACVENTEPDKLFGGITVETQQVHHVADQENELTL